MSDFFPKGFVYVSDVLEELIIRRFGDDYRNSVLNENDIKQYCFIDKRRRERAPDCLTTAEQRADDIEMEGLNARHSARWAMHDSVWNDFRSELLFGNYISRAVTDEGFIQVPSKVWAHAYVQHPPGYVGWIHEGMFVSGKALIAINERDKLLASDCATATPTSSTSVVKLEHVPETSKVGRPLKYDWLAIHIMMARELWLGNVIDNQSELIKAVQQRYYLKYNVEPGTTQLKKPAREFIAAYQDKFG